MPCPKVDHGATAHHHRDGSAHFAVVGEVLRERFLDALEPGVANTLNDDRCCHEGFLLSGSWPNGTPKEASLWRRAGFTGVPVERSPAPASWFRPRPEKPQRQGSRPCRRA